MQNFPLGYEGSRTTDDRTTMIQVGLKKRKK